MASSSPDAMICCMPAPILSASSYTSGVHVKDKWKKEKKRTAAFTVNAKPCRCAILYGTQTECYNSPLRRTSSSLISLALSSVMSYPHITQMARAAVTAGMMMSASLRLVSVSAV